MADFDKIFLSTLSLRRATDTGKEFRPSRSNFYPRSPCGERRIPLHDLVEHFLISIHALLAESDRMDVLTIFRG